MASDHSPGPACRTVFERSSPDKVSCAKAGLEFRKEAVSTAFTKRWIDNTHPTNFFTCKTARADRFCSSHAKQAWKYPEPPTKQRAGAKQGNVFRIHPGNFHSGRNNYSRGVPSSGDAAQSRPVRSPVMIILIIIVNILILTFNHAQLTNKVHIITIELIIY